MFMPKRDDLFKRKWQAEALTFCMVLSLCDITNVLICQFLTGLNLIIVICGKLMAIYAHKGFLLHHYLIVEQKH